MARTRTFEFGRGAGTDTNDPVSTFFGPWGIKTTTATCSAARLWPGIGRAESGTREIWTLKNGGGGWDHRSISTSKRARCSARNGSLSNVPAAERGRKDVYRLRPGGSITITMQFRDWGGMFMEHCHNTVHEDNAMLLRWEIDDGGAPFLRPLPTPYSVAAGRDVPGPGRHPADRPQVNREIEKERNMKTRRLLSHAWRALVRGRGSGERGRVVRLPCDGADHDHGEYDQLYLHVLVDEHHHHRCPGFDSRAPWAGVPESVIFSGQAKLSASVVTDPDFGNSPNRRAFHRSQQRHRGRIVQREEVRHIESGSPDPATEPCGQGAAHVPVCPERRQPTTSRVGMASFNMSFNVNSFKLTGATGQIASP